LGDRFLVLLYEVLVASPSAFSFAAVADGRVLGFIVGATDTGLVFKEFARRGGARAFVALAPRLLSWRRLKRVVETLLYPSRKDDGLPEPEILNFGVRPATQGQGVGAALFDRLVEEFRSRGVESIRIVTGESQQSAQAFYERRGARLAKTVELHKGTRSRVYVYDLG
jgi:ribosomal protein S18 acetylase RimI-like enzyme